MVKPNPKHPYGTTLLSRDTPENRQTWGAEGIGLIGVAESVCTADGECPHYHYQVDATHEKALETPIHMLIASFRDRLCPRTIHNAFSRAENPSRIFVRVIEQTVEGSDLPDDAGCFEKYCQDYNQNCEEFRSQVRIVHRDAWRSKGPTDARSKLSAMIYHDFLHRNSPNALDFVPVQLEDFCMQIDSHMDFSDNYDTELIFMHHRTQNDYAVLSTYVADIAQNNKDVRDVPNLCMVQFTSTIRNWGTKICHNLVRPKLTNAMWGAGLSMHRCHAEIVVPVDPYLDSVFDGEEGSRGIRFYTHGYDVYTPDRVLVTHDYHTHQGNPVVHTWGGKLRKDKALAATEPEEEWEFMKVINAARPLFHVFGTKRVNLLLGIGPDSQKESNREEVDLIRTSRFGLGNKRSLVQAIEFTGIDLLNRKMVKNKCGNLLWTPFEESETYGVPAILQRIPVQRIPTELPVILDRESEKHKANLADPQHEAAASHVTTGSNYSLYVGLLLCLSLVCGRYFVLGKRRKHARHTN